MFFTVAVGVCGDCDDEETTKKGRRRYGGGLLPQLEEEGAVKLSAALRR